MNGRELIAALTSRIRNGGDAQNEIIIDGEHTGAYTYTVSGVSVVADKTILKLKRVGL